VLALTLVEIFLALILVVPWFLVLYDAIRWAAPVWTGAGKNKILWVAFILLLPPLGVLSYLILVRPELVSEQNEGAVTRLPDSLSDGVDEVNPLLLMRRNTVVAIGLLLAAIAIAGVLGVLQLWRLA
jgi:hypothetical protein